MATAINRRRFPRSERRAEILRVATRHFHARGYEAASLQDIADELGIRKASLYYYFSSKQELLHALLGEIIGLGMQNARDIIALGGDPLTRLWRIVIGHIDQLCRYSVETAVFLHERKRIPPEQRPQVLSDDYAYQRVFIDSIVDGLACGQVRADIDPKLAALSILGSANWTYAWYKPDGDLKPRYIGAQFAAMTINSIASDEAMQTWRPPAAPPSAPSSMAPSAGSTRARRPARESVPGETTAKLVQT